MTYNEKQTRSQQAMFRVFKQQFRVFKSSGPLKLFESLSNSYFVLMRVF